MSKDFDIGMQALYAGDLNKAEEFLLKAAKTDPMNAEVHFNLGKVHRQKGQFTTAINDFQKALDINPLHNQAKTSIEMVKQILGFRNPDLYNH